MISAARAVSIFVALFTAGCASGTQAVFSRAPDPADEAATMSNASAAGDVIAMPYSKIMVGKASGEPDANKKRAGERPPKEGDAPQVKADPTYDATAVPSESAHRYIVTAHRSLFSESTITITRLPNTDIPAEVNGAFKNTAVERINAFGGIISSVLSVTALDAAPVAGCDKAELPEFVVPAKQTARTNVPGDKCWEYTIAEPDGSKPAFGSVTYDKFDATLGKPVRYFPVPACRDYELKVNRIGTPSPTERTFQIRVADPDRVRLVPLPIKGKIAMHPICGADVADEGSIDRLADAQAILAALANQAKAIEELQEKKKKSSAATPGQ